MKLTSNCKKCGLHKYVNHPQVMGRGNDKNPQVIMIGEAPGAVEDQKGLPFMGKAGRKLDEMIKPYLGTYYLTNVVKCLPPGENTTFRTPTLQEVEYCKPFLMRELLSFTEVTPLLVPLGNVALTCLIGENKGITRELGTIKQVKIGFKNYTVVPQYHPSYICRNQTFESSFISTMKKIYEYVDSRTI